MSGPEIDIVEDAVAIEPAWTDGRRRLTGYYDEVNDSVRALLFGELARRAAPVVKQYQSDLYHDAHWVAEHVVGPIEFFYGVRAFGGTSIGTDRKLVCYSNQRVWKVELVVERGEWSSIITEIELS